MFSESKTAQTAAFFLDQEGRSMPILKLMKLLYLTDRESMKRYGEPVSYDAMVSMPHGPVLSMTLDYINGMCESKADGWEGWIKDRENHRVSLARTFNRDDLDELSDADIEVMKSVWAEFGGMDQWEIRDYTHDHCPEWKDPAQSAIPIQYADVFRALGKDEDEALTLQNTITEQNRIDSVFAAL